MFSHVLVATDLEKTIAERFDWVVDLVRAEDARMTVLLTVITMQMARPRATLGVLERGAIVSTRIRERALGVDCGVRYGFGRDGVSLALGVAHDLGCDRIILALPVHNGRALDRRTLWLPPDAFSERAVEPG
ncbi:MAG: hypothetical protein WBW32_18580 [Luteibacter sp.]